MRSVIFLRRTASTSSHNRTPTLLSERLRPGDSPRSWPPITGRLGTGLRSVFLTGRWPAADPARVAVIQPVWPGAVPGPVRRPGLPAGSAAASPVTAAVALIRLLARQAGPVARSRRRPGSSAGIRRKRWFLAHCRRVRSSAPGRSCGCPLESNGPSSRDFGPQRPPTPQDKAEQGKQPSNGGGEYR